jgi:hypothetical protein
LQMGCKVHQVYSTPRMVTNQ